MLTDLLNVVGMPTADAADADAGASAEGTQGAGPEGGTLPDERTAPDASDARAAPSATAASSEELVSDDEAKLIRRVDAEGRRARKSGWRRLHPSPLSARGVYAPFFDAARRHVHTLPFEVEQMACKS